MVQNFSTDSVDFSGKKVRIDGVVYNKFELIEFMRHLDFNRFWYRLMYAYDTMSYSDIRNIFKEYIEKKLFLS